MKIFMWKGLAFFVLLASAIGLSVFFDRDIEDEVKGETEVNLVKLGYCQTFEQFAIDIGQKNENIVLEKLDSSFAVLSELGEGNLDYGLIGRKAYGYELAPGTQEIPLQEPGLTLISQEKGFVDYDELKNLEIHTYLEKEIVEDFFEFGNITFHDEIEKAIEEGLNSAVLISWQDWDDDFELLIPIDEFKKVEKFRTPILYTKDEDLNLSL